MDGVWLVMMVGWSMWWWCYEVWEIMGEGVNERGGLVGFIYSFGLKRLDFFCKKLIWEIKNLVLEINLKMSLIWIRYLMISFDFLGVKIEEDKRNIFF